mmetsp:Transcript_95854/g.309480  ORF Transcript_95854/g.309480 Transcript_95854/m.309480 type:complete len:224 (-) Transcript_95854:717-1388(-)
MAWREALARTALGPLTARGGAARPQGALPAAAGSGHSRAQRCLQRGLRVGSYSELTELATLNGRALADHHSLVPSSLLLLLPPLRSASSTCAVGGSVCGSSTTAAFPAASSFAIGGSSFSLGRWSSAAGLFAVLTRLSQRSCDQRVGESLRARFCEGPSWRSSWSLYHMDLPEPFPDLSASRSRFLALRGSHWGRRPLPWPLSSAALPKPLPSGPLVVPQAAA